MKNLSKRKLWVALGSEANSLNFHQGSKNEQIQELIKDKAFTYFEVSSLTEASQLCQKFIQHFDLGASNWVGGRIMDDDFNFVAKISYNGKIWNSETWETSREIKL